MAQRFYLTRRPDRGNRWYCRFRTAGGVIPWQSTGETEKSKATKWAQEHLPDKPQWKGRRERLLFSTFAKDWWLPSHEYVQRQLARGRSLSRHYLDNARAQLRRYILPAFGGCRLSAITTAQIDDWLFHLHKECHLNADTANHCLGRLRQMLDYASFQGYIAGNPAREVEPLAIKAKVRGILTPAEVGELFATPWKDKRVCAAALLGCSCGLRLGEIQGLQWQHLHLDEPQPWLSVQL